MKNVVWRYFKQKYFSTPVSTWEPSPAELVIISPISGSCYTKMDAKLFENAATLLPGYIERYFMQIV